MRSARLCEAWLAGRLLALSCCRTRTHTCAHAERLVPRSGSGVHKDPLATSAWNTLAHGRKWWVLLDPTIEKDIVKPTHQMVDDQAFTWFGTVLPRLIQSGVPVRV